MQKHKLGLFSKILIAIAGGVALGWLLGEPKSPSALDESTQEGKLVKAGRMEEVKGDASLEEVFLEVTEEAN